MYDTHEKMGAAYKRLADKLNAADKCKECEQCEKLCPQGIEIINKLKDAHKHLLSV
jgi:predicted aldo/keto reductase-like oxidoreductase